MEAYYHTAYLDLLGAVIHRAILDYQRISPSSRSNGIYYTSAKYFLFSPNGLEAMVARAGVSEFINLDFIRRVANNEKVRPLWIDRGSSVSIPDFPEE